jgi:predicted HicB family RNase H-like nuclease
MNNTKQIHIKLEPSLHHALKLEATYNQQTIQDLVVELITNRVESTHLLHLAQDKKNEK